ncbi:ribbon-helix-helix protein, CopG family [Rhizobiaceae bacterium CRRU44]|uniref:Ribbon-helix-helix protein, CopG family n=1 Tax=Ferranicluibacter rubi TaxID=2715133 RepID=A0AA43ZHC0_9HYPH|nr:ribbon-helix-helix protein, CopG family [Ferranicluibacter rubi]NHT77908.1 ribbon-helix-helix protein, CopG family [Ferranicluibacter rubi]TCP83537.1 ribbon-helix-helix CopG family protein [Rhizobium sp. PP-CC-2G-626]
MKEEYDFSNAERGKFYRRGASLVLPVHLDDDVLHALSQEAGRQGVSLSDLANRLLKRDLDEMQRTG